MRIALGADHRGFKYKERIASLLREIGHIVKDFGTFSDTQSVDYPDYALLAARAVSNEECDCAILICGTGVGMCITANKVNGVRAAIGNDLFTTIMSRKHNDSNVLCIGADVASQDPLEERVKLWLSTPFEAEERHIRRLGKMVAVENKNNTQQISNNR
ncbi:MAG TPA: ribose 5-phosphate isomerase B [Candidatus Brocadiia bacterium]|nr:ribose 5-phosphate isomerase B [Chloroflexota bacterium]MBI4008268.1 ribose 5-phosphate isomerase B [Planctomycetota bacterium]MDO8093254.1 ribose 5-phosphate isomerase B [Candidatus Brocadiales bacterium]